MDFWIIRDGEKIGPYPDYEIRSKIQHGDLERDSRVWSEGLEGWTKLDGMDLFREEFEKRDPRSEPDPAPVPPPLPMAAPAPTDTVKPKAYMMYRFWARWLDLTVYGSLWWLGLYFSGRDIGAVLGSIWMLLPMYIPWFVLESWLLHKYGTTPGKWLMGLRVLNEDGSLLTLPAATKRSLRVLVSGIGFGWNYLALICQLMSWFTTRRIGKPIWDYLGEHKVVAKPIIPLKIAVLVCVFVVSMFLRLAIQGRHIEKIIVENNPEMKQYYEVWHWIYLPDRSGD
ncbi:MAG: RDD family protein [Verrucomicrobia bacterium]|jgi:uncharacterized RDD family membrane protein YckC|nr:RDD family protein [Verrucomicrobiota bacterium]